MKKVILMACLVAAATSSMAQDVKIYKAEEQMKEKKYAEAIETINGVLANPKTKKLAFANFMAGEIYARQLNDQIELLKSGKCDTTLFITSLEKAVGYFTESNKIDQTPDEKGRVRPKYYKPFKTDGLENYSGNRKRLMDMRLYYGYAAQFENARHNTDGSFKYFVKDLEFPQNPVFTKQETDSIYKKNAKYYSRIGYYAAMLAYEKKDYDAVLKYAPYALQDSTSLRDGYVMIMTAELEKGDTASWINTCKQAIHDMPNNVANSQNLLKYYDDHKMVNEAKQMADELVQKSPNSKVAWYTRGCVMMNTVKNYPEARAAFSKALAIDKNFVYALFNQGCTYVNELMSIKDQLCTDRTKVDQYNRDMAKARKYYQDALPYFENTLVLAPDKTQLWGYNLQTVYYNLQDGAQKAEMVKKEADMKQVVEGKETGEEFIQKYGIKQHDVK